MIDYGGYAGVFEDKAYNMVWDLHCILDAFFFLLFHSLMFIYPRVLDIDCFLYSVLASPNVRASYRRIKSCTDTQV